MVDAYKRLDTIPNATTEKTIPDNVGDPQGQYPKAE